MTMEQRADPAAVPPATDAGWVEEMLLAGPDSQVCFRVPEPIDRARAAGGWSPTGASG